MNLYRIRNLEVYSDNPKGGIYRYSLDADISADECLSDMMEYPETLSGKTADELSGRFFSAGAENPQKTLTGAARGLLMHKGITAVTLSLKKNSVCAFGSSYEDIFTVSERWHRVFLSLSSNKGNMKSYVQKAVKKLEENEYIREASNSRITHYDESEKGECVACVVKLETVLSPEELMAYVNLLEVSCGREFSEDNSGCEIDIDILMYDRLISEKEQLILPHPGIPNRKYILKGMAELAPDVLHPVLSKTMRELNEKIK